MCVSSPWCCFSPPAPLDLSRTRVTDFAADGCRLSLMEKLGQPHCVVSRLCNVQGGTRERGAHRSELTGDARTAPIPQPRARRVRVERDPVPGSASLGGAAARLWVESACFRRTPQVAQLPDFRATGRGFCRMTPYHLAVTTDPGTPGASVA